MNKKNILLVLMFFALNAAGNFYGAADEADGFPNFLFQDLSASEAESILPGVALQRNLFHKNDPKKTFVPIICGCMLNKIESLSRNPISTSLRPYMPDVTTFRDLNSGGGVWRLILAMKSREASGKLWLDEPLIQHIGNFLHNAPEGCREQRIKDWNQFADAVGIHPFSINAIDSYTKRPDGSFSNL